MEQVLLERRVDRLEDLMADLIRAQQNTQRQLDLLAAEMREFKEEMRAFKDEMRAFKDEMLVFKDEMRAFKDEMRAFKDEMRAFKDEMSDFKDEMRDFKDEMRETMKQMNRQWSDLVRKMGTMAEDIIAPGIPTILRQVVGCDPDQESSLAVRVKRRLQDGRVQEFDVVATCGDYALINETKTRLLVEDVRNFLQALQHVRDFFPEFQNKRILGAMASFYVEENVVHFAERHGLIVIGMGEENLRLLNSPDFTPKTF